MKDHNLQGFKQTKNNYPKNKKNPNKWIPTMDKVNKNYKSTTASNQIWSMDTKQIKTQEGWLYLFVIIDFYSNNIVSYNTFSNKSYQDLILPALEKISQQFSWNQINFENKFSENDDVNTLAVDKDKNIYFGIYQNGGGSNGTYFFKNGETKLKKIIERNTNKIIIDGFNNVYFATDYKTFVLKFTNEEQLISINRLENIENILIDNNNNIYFINDTVYLLAKNKVKTDTPTAKKIDNLVGINIWNSFINKLNNNIYFATSNGAYILRLDN